MNGFTLYTPRNQVHPPILEKPMKANKLIIKVEKKILLDVVTGKSG